jgi:hypothetical protein
MARIGLVVCSAGSMRVSSRRTSVRLWRESMSNCRVWCGVEGANGRRVWTYCTVASRSYRRACVQNVVSVYSGVH